MSDREASDTPRRRVRVRISGRVQGVAYRYSTRARAAELALTGWVRNLPDGDVEAVFAGSSDRVDSMIDWCRRGPPLARVAEVRVDELPDDGDDSTPHATFEIRT